MKRSINSIKYLLLNLCITFGTLSIQAAEKRKAEDDLNTGASKKTRTESPAPVSSSSSSSSSSADAGDSKESKESKEGKEGTVIVAPQQGFAGTQPDAYTRLLQSLLKKDRLAKAGISVPAIILITGPKGTGKTLLIKELVQKITGARLLTYDPMALENAKTSHIDLLEAVTTQINYDVKNAQATKTKIPSCWIVHIPSITLFNPNTIGQNMDYWRKQVTDLKRKINAPNAVLYIIAEGTDIIGIKPTLYAFFDYTIQTKLPTFEDRNAILHHFIGLVPLAKEASLQDSITKIANETEHFSGEDLKRLVDIAVLIAATAQDDPKQGILKQAHLFAALNQMQSTRSSKSSGSPKRKTFHPDYYS